MNAAPKDEKTRPPGGRTDGPVDENGMPVDVPEPAEVTLAKDVEQAVESGNGPANWSRLALLALAALVAVLLLLQIMGGDPGTDVVPGTPAAAPEIPDPQAPAPLQP